jgi:IclR family acetate operon transcriptional repressor
MTYSPSKSIRKAFALLECLNQTSSGLSASEVSRRVNIPGATTHRLLKELVNLGYVRWDCKRQTYSVGFRLTLFGNRRLTIERIVHRARPALRYLSQHSGLTVYLGSLEGQQVIIEDRAIYDEQTRFCHSVGSHIDAHAHSMGKALLALLPPKAVLAAYEATALQAHTRNTIRTTGILLKQLKDVAANGYAVDNEELKVGTSSIAAALMNPKGRALCAISLEGPKHKFSSEHMAGMTALLMQATSAIMQDVKEPTELRW